MRILVTGAAGFAGRHLLRALHAAGFTELVGTTFDPEGAPQSGGDRPGEELSAQAAGEPGARALASRGGSGEITAREPGRAAASAPPRPPAPHGSGGSALPVPAGVEWLPLDLACPDSVHSLVRSVRPDRIYHLAGQASVGASFAEPLATWEVNATGTLMLLNALRSDSPRTNRVLLVSSAEVYGAVPASAQPIVEDAPLRPGNPYGASKAAAEIAALQIGRSGGAEVVVARSFNHIGPGQDERFVLPSIARQLRQIGRGARDPVVRVGNLEVERDFLDVRDVARAYLRIMEQGEAGAVFNVCSGTARSLLEIVQRLIELSGTGARVEIDPARVRPIDIPRLVGDPARLRGLGWQPEIDLDRTMRELLEEAEAS